MADVHDKIVRSYNMSRIRSKNTKPEIIVRKFLHSHGFRYRLHVKTLIGKPDIVLKKYNTVILVQGCFWHGHKQCKDFVIPKTNQEYWVSKIEKNLARDENSIAEINSLGWNVIVLWECEIKSRGQKLESLLAYLRSFSDTKHTA
jgi:DNA mismatch endonuclease (patch repair protein)